MVLRRKSSDNVMENDRGGEKSAHALSGRKFTHHNDKYPVNIFVIIQFQWWKARPALGGCDSIPLSLSLQLVPVDVVVAWEFIFWCRSSLEIYILIELMSTSVNLCGIELIDQNYQTPSCHWRKLIFWWELSNTSHCSLQTKEKQVKAHISPAKPGVPL